MTTTSSTQEDGGGGAGGGTTTMTVSTTTTTTTTGPVSCDVDGTAAFPAEIEPNDIANLATPLLAGAQGATASLCPAADIDVFSFEVANGDAARIEITAPGGSGCPLGAQTYLRLFDENGVLVAEDVDSGAASCSLIDPAQGPTASLPGGTYFAHVESVTFTTVKAYEISVEMSAPACGDGVLQQAGGEQCDDGGTMPGDGCDENCQIEVVCGDGIAHLFAGEQCDDGNAADGDGCSTTCQLELLLIQETEPNGPMTPTSIAGYEGAIGAISSEGDQDCYAVDVPTAGSSLLIETSDGLGGCPVGNDGLGVDTFLTLYGPDGSVVETDDDEGVDFCSLLSPQTYPSVSNLDAGTYVACVTDLGNNDIIPVYVLTAQVLIPGCGDTLVQAGEQCDDGNMADGDGCSGTCQSESPWEIEPNGTLAEATPLWPSTSFWFGAITPVADHDFFSFDVAAGQGVIASTSSIGNVASCPFDTVLHLMDSAGNNLAIDDDSGVEVCSKITPATHAGASNLPAGTYYLQVYRLGDAVPGSAPYHLDVQVQ